MIKLTTITILLALVALAGCGRHDASRPPKGRTESVQSPGGVSESAVEHGAAGAEPGSHADWCGKHQVPESLCTRCNPSLAPAFKATGDWCAEHALPESQCLLCNPELKIVRPPQDDEDHQS